MATSFLPQSEWDAAEVDMDPYVVVCRAFREAGIPFLVIGAFGIDLHATEHGLGIVTYDLDLLLPARADVLGPALACLADLGCALAWNGEAMPLPNELLLGDLLRAHACITATLGKSSIDIVLHAAKLDFDELWPRRERRTIGTLSVDTAPLADLLISKAAANRLKDRLFIEIWRELIDKMLTIEERRRVRADMEGGEAPRTG